MRQPAPETASMLERDVSAAGLLPKASAGSWRVLSVLRFFVAVVVAGAVTGAIALNLPRPLAVRTDIVGYPIYRNYNIELPLQRYYLLVVLFPLAAFLLYIGLGRLGRRLGLTGAPSESDEPDATEPATTVEEAWRERWGAAARVLTVGAAFGLEVAISGDQDGWWFVLTVAAVGLAYAAALVGATLGLARLASSRSRRDLLATLDALAAPLLLVGLLAVSAATEVTVRADGAVHPYPWLPAWLALPATAAAVLWIGAAVARTSVAARVVERRVVLFLVAPVALFLVIAAVPGPLRPMDMFHEGEYLAATQLTLDGYFPWRDLLTIHGVLQDQLSSLPGFAIFGDSRWGAVAGTALLVRPLIIVFLFLFAAVMFERAWPTVVASLAVLICGSLSTNPVFADAASPLTLVWDARFMFWPLLLVLMKVALERAGWWWSAGLGAALTVQTLLAPESAYCLAAVGATVVLRDWCSRERREPLVSAFSRSIWFSAGAGALGTAVAGYLLVNHALGPFVFYFVEFGSGHELTGGLPVAVRAWLANPALAFLALSTPVAVLLSIWYLAAALLRSRRLDALDWVLAAASLFALAYYTKFLARADLHVIESYTATVPVFALLLYRGQQAAECWAARARPVSRIAWRLTTRPVAVTVMVAALLGAAGVARPLTAAPAHFRPQVPAEPWLSRLGYSGEAGDRATYGDVDRVLSAYLRRDDWVFDFSNAPAFYYYLLDRRPHTRYFNVSMALLEVAQLDLLAELRRDRPRLVVLTNDRFGMPSWDGIPNAVRHYDVSQYILDNYRPLLSIRGQVLYADAAAGLTADQIRDLPLGERPVTQDLPFLGSSCDWGAAPNFLSVRPPARAQSAPSVTVQPGASGEATVVDGWAVGSVEGAPAREVVAVADGRVVARGPTGLDRPDVAKASGLPASARSGFELEIPGALESVGPTLRLYAVSATGLASELSYGPGVLSGGGPLATLDLGGGQWARVQPGAARGEADGMRGVYRLEISAAAGATWSEYRWLEIDASGSGLRSDTWTISDVLGRRPGREISFQTLDGARSIRVYVGSCPQWHGYAAGSLLVSHDHPQQVTSFRLVSS